MVKKIFRPILIALLLLIVFVLIQTFRFSSAIAHTKAMPAPALNDSAVAHISEAIKIKTISVNDVAAIDTTAFQQFKVFLENSYPLIHSRLKRVVINNFSYIYFWEGKNRSLPPYILMAHSDVVPVEKSSENLWHVQPFSGEIKDSSIWGRGAIDDKGCLVSIMEAAENLLQKNYQPERSFYLCFGHREELGGKGGADEIVRWLDSIHVKPSLVLDEGGIITKDNFKDLGRPIALLGVVQKGYASFDLSVQLEGGHSSMPARETAIDVLSKALVNIRKEQMPVSFSQPTQLMLQKIGPGMPFTTRMAIANEWLFKPLLVAQFEKGNATNATIHTTIVPTIIGGGIKDNVVPSSATAVVNSRIMPGQTSKDVLSFLQKSINDERVKIVLQKETVTDPTIMTDVESEAYKNVASATYKIMDDVIPVPFLMIGGADSRYYNKLCNNIINYSPMLDPKGFHGVDEHINFDDLKRMIFFYQLLLQQ